MDADKRKYLYNIKEAAELLGVGRTTMYELKQSGKLKVTMIGSRGIRFSDDELRRFIAENTENR